jgi:hypothetical protein
MINLVTMKKFTNLDSVLIDANKQSQLKATIVSELEKPEHSPFKNIQDSIKIVEARENNAYFSTYEIFNESRNIKEHTSPTREPINAYTPLTRKDNVDTWSYSIEFREKYIEHSVFHLIEDSKNVKTCQTCKGSTKEDCSICSASGNCNSCKGKGEDSCKCGNGNCLKCNGNGEVRCESKECANGRCTSCSGNGQKACGWCDGSGKVHELATDRYFNCQKCRGSGVLNCTTCQGKGIHDGCKGTGMKRCPDCTWKKGKHTECDGTGKLTCAICRGSGNCNECKGKGDVTCSGCKGYGNLLHYLEVEAMFQNNISKLQLIENVNSYNEIDLSALLTSNELEIASDKSEFKTDDLKRFSEISEINSFLLKVKENSSAQNIIEERIKLFKIKITTIDYTFNGKTYTSYFIGKDNHYFYKNNPLKDYNNQVENEVDKLISQTNYSKAIKLLEEQISRYGSLNDENGINASKEKLDKAKLEIQKDLRKGAFFAQLAFILFDFVSILFIFYSMNSNNDKIIFQWILLPIIFYRIGLYFKHLIPKFLFKDFEYSLVNQCINGDDKSDYYHINTKLLNFLRVTGVLGVIVFFIFNYDKNISTSLAISLVVYLFYYGITLVTTMMIDIYKHRRLDEKTLSFKNSASRILHSFSFNILVVSLIGVIVFFTSAIFADGTIEFYWFELRDHIDTSNRNTIDGLNLFLNNSIYFLLVAVGLNALLMFKKKK